MTDRPLEAMDCVLSGNPADILIDALHEIYALADVYSEKQTAIARKALEAVGELER